MKIEKWNPSWQEEDKAPCVVICDLRHMGLGRPWCVSTVDTDGGITLSHSAGDFRTLAQAVKYAKKIAQMPGCPIYRMS